MDTNRYNYINAYNKEKYKMYPFRVKYSNMALVQKLDSVSNRNEYLTNLVLNDLDPGVLTLKQIKDRIKPIMKKHGIKDVYLFGSYARGEANRNSDVDIYCDPGDVRTLWDHSAFEEELAEALAKSVDVIMIGSSMHDFFRQQLEEDMIKIC